MKKEFNWPEYNSDAQRIKTLSKRYRSVDIVKAFEEEYRTKIKTTSKYVNTPPPELKIGDVIEVTAHAFDGRRINFSMPNQENTIFATGMGDKIILGNTYKAEIIDIDNHGIKVNLYNPIIKEHIIDVCNNPISQNNISNPYSVDVDIISLTKGGYFGKAIISTESGLSIEVDAFVPGSQITLNIESNFERWIGKRIKTHILNYNIKYDGSFSIVCSRKQYLKTLGMANLINYYDKWCQNIDISSTGFDGYVTGVINSSKKCGVFVEIPDLCITGLMPVESKELVDYKINDKVSVAIIGFDEQLYYNSDVGQVQHSLNPYEVEWHNDEKYIKYCYLKPIIGLFNK